jgi:membrane protein YqaA with SNARE-associated domain
MVIEKLKQKRWLKMALYIAILVGVSVGLWYLFDGLCQHFGISDQTLERFASTGYLVVFAISLAFNALIVVPVYIHIGIMMKAAELWNPALVALAASVGGVLGELTAYYAGYWGKRIARLENAPGYERLVGWMKKYGPWGIFLISLQPIFPVDVAGLLAGASKLPVWKFLVPCWAAKFIKYLLACYLGETFLRLLPPLLL